MLDIMKGILEALEDPSLAKENMKGDLYTQQAIQSMSAILIHEMQDMDLQEAPTYKGKHLLPLGEPWGTVSVGNISCTRNVHLGPDGRIYIEGPRKTLGGVVIDIHPYSIDDAKGWHGITARQISDLMTTYFI